MKVQAHHYTNRLPRSIQRALDLIYSTSLNDLIYRMVEEGIKDGTSIRAVCRRLAGEHFTDLTPEAVLQRYLQARNEYQEDQ